MICIVSLSPSAKPVGTFWRFPQSRLPLSVVAWIVAHTSEGVPMLNTPLSEGMNEPFKNWLVTVALNVEPITVRSLVMVTGPKIVPPLVLLKRSGRAVVKAGSVSVWR